jgi:hypothetical protein
VSDSVVSGEPPWQQAAEQFFRALGNARWMEAATLVDPASASLFRERQLASLVGWALQRDALKAWRKKAEGGSFGWSSDGVVTSEGLAATADTTLAAIPGVSTLGELASMSAAAFVAKYFEISNSHDAKGGVGPRRILGGVAEGDAMVHVLYRDERAGISYADPYHVDRLRLKQTRSEWFVDLWGDPEFASGHEFMRLADDFFASMGRNEDVPQMPGENEYR